MRRWLVVVSVHIFVHVNCRKNETKRCESFAVLVLNVFNGNCLVSALFYSEANTIQWVWADGRIGKVISKDFRIEN